MSDASTDRPRALVHVPSRLDPGTPVALVCMLHGCTQDPATFAAATLMNDAADRHGFVVVYPSQDPRRNAQRCWNWFVPEHQRRGAGEPATIAASVAELIDANDRCTIDPRRVFVAGLSAGGAMAVVLGACYPDLFTAVAVHSGVAYGVASNPDSALRAMAHGAPDGDAGGGAVRSAMGDHARALPSLVIHGSLDRRVAPVNAIEILRQSMEANHLAAPELALADPERPTASVRGAVEGGHAFTRSQWVDERGALMHELVMVDELAHAWSGGAEGGSYTDPQGPSATEMISEFFALTTFPAGRVAE